ncbi:MAG: diguanylate cyclase [Alphaproteobacteria bacterium]|nr:diguanylate cyclase [Alphaproteobacteria bacterium]
MVWYLKAINSLNSILISRKDVVMRLAGILCAAIGIIVLIGWYTHTPLLYQFSAGLIPMYFNTAFCFILLGLGMSVLPAHYKKMALFPAITTIMIAGLTLLEYLLNIDFGIDQLFFKTYYNIHDPAPGRMSPNSALSFLICGTAISLLSLNLSRFFYCIVLLLGIGVLALASISLLGYAAQLPATYQWAHLTPMSLPTAITFMITSTGIIFYVYIKHASGEIKLSSTLPYFAALFILFISALLWQTSLQEATRNVQEFTDAEAARIKENIEEELTERITDLEELHFQWQTLPNEPKERWLIASDFYKKNSPWYKSIEWIDPSLHIRGVTPLKENELLLNIALDSFPFLHETIEAAKREQKLKISKITKLIPEGRGFLICIPLLKQSQFNGFIIATIDVDTMLRDILDKRPNSDFEVAFFEDQQNKDSFFQSHIAYISKISSKKEIDIYNLNWTVKVWPSVELYKQHTYTLLSKLILLFGPFIALLLFAGVRSLQTARKNALMLQEAKKSLELELTESSHHMESLRCLKDMINALQACSSLEKAAIPIAKSCKRFFPSTSGAIYLTDHSSHLLTPFSTWGKKTSKLSPFPQGQCLAIEKESTFYMSGKHNLAHCAHIKNSFSKQLPKTAFLCMPLFDQNEVFGLLQIRDNQLLSLSESEQAKQILLAETFSRQLSVSLTSLKIHDLLTTQAIHDPLTGLYNRRFLDESLQREIYRANRYSHPISLLMLDIDHFKRINDTYGHNAGDEVLKVIALLLQKYSRKSDIACRFGGEEFILILPETTLQIASQRAEELRETVTTLDVISEGKTIQNLSISLGIATYPQHGATLKEITTAVDQALYTAKSLGRNRVAIAENIKGLKGNKKT